MTQLVSTPDRKKKTHKLTTRPPQNLEENRKTRFNGPSNLCPKNGLPMGDFGNTKGVRSHDYVVRKSCNLAHGSVTTAHIPYYEINSWTFHHGEKSEPIRLRANLLRPFDLRVPEELGANGGCELSRKHSVETCIQKASRHIILYQHDKAPTKKTVQNHTFWAVSSHWRWDRATKLTMKLLLHTSFPAV